MDNLEDQRPEDCREVFAELSAYLDAELPADMCREVEAHLSDCPPCIEFVNSLRRTVDLCRKYRAGAIPAPLGETARKQLLTAYRKMLATRGGQPKNF